MTPNEELYDTYLRAASTDDQDERVRLLRTVAADDFEIVSPFPYVLRSLDEVATKLGEVAAAQPGGRLDLRRTTVVDAHNSVFRVAYANIGADGAALSTGLHVVEVSDGKLARIVVFVPADLPAPLSGS
jgi:hypothetical protein